MQRKGVKLGDDYDHVQLPLHARYRSTVDDAYTYTLNVNFPADVLPDLVEAGLKLNIVKGEGAPSQESPQVVWINTVPFQQNAIQWNETYGLYASTVEIQNGAKLGRMSTQYPAQFATGYQFGVNSVPNFTTDQSIEVPKMTFGVLNSYTPLSKLTMGLTQRALVSGTVVDSEINANVVPKSYPAFFTPVVQLTVWMDANLSSSTVITNITGEPLVVDFTGVATRSITYNPNTGSFTHPAGLFRFQC
eukprot:TRINITY_DN3863_c0_g1_i1.p1 TRINITY_DN3863_c0_g1~~TRINITY_DN3863_c0_g1_i1.p1  ORF type:complete len:247 (-),score=38.74 TRINITY_DN3863_c0_g1_i1:399-1139(-)